MITVSDTIPVEKFEKFHEILKACDGRYKVNPSIMGATKRVDVYYEIDINGYRELNERWRLVTEDIVEVSNKSWIQTFIRKVKGVFCD